MLSEKRNKYCGHIFSRAIVKASVVAHIYSIYSVAYIYLILYRITLSCSFNYTTIMIGKVYGLNLELQFCVWEERYGCCSIRQVGFGRGSQFWITYWPSYPVARTAESIIRGFSPIIPIHATRQSRAIGSPPGHNKRITIGQAIAIFRAHRPQTYGSWSLHHCHQLIKAITSCHGGASLPLEIFPFWTDFSL